MKKPLKVCAKREQQIIQQREQRELFDFSGKDHKPNKKERRLIHRFKQVECNATDRLAV